jgi:hypothetical protein
MFASSCTCHRPGRLRPDWKLRLIELVGAFLVVAGAGLLAAGGFAAILASSPWPTGASVVGFGMLRSGWRLVMRPEDPWRWAS